MRYTGGTYLFFQSTAPLARVQGTVTEGGSLARLVLVEFCSWLPSIGAQRTCQRRYASIHSREHGVDST
jgi:hypothetical protein